MISQSPELLAEAKAKLPALEAAAKSEAGHAGVRRAIGSRFATFPQPERSEGEWTMFWADYAEVLGDLPEAAINAALSAWIRLPDAEFLPKPGKLLALAKDAVTQELLAYQRARAAIQMAERASRLALAPPAPPEAPNPTPEEAERQKAEILTWVAQFCHKPEMAPKAATKPEET